MNDALDFGDDDPTGGDDLPPGFEEVTPDEPAAPAKKAPAKRGRPRKAPAKKAPAKKADTAPKMGRPSNDAKLQQRVEQQLEAIGLGLAGLGVATASPVLGQDAASVMEHAEPIAAALVEVSKGNEKVRKALERGADGGAWLGVVIAVGGLAKSIAANHMAEPEELTASAPAMPSPFGGLAQAAGQGGQ